MRVLIVLAFVIALIPLISVLWTTIANGIERFNLDFLTPQHDRCGRRQPDPVRWLWRRAPRHHRHAGDHAGRHGHLDPDRPDVRRCTWSSTRNRGKLAKSISLLVDVMSGIPSIVAGLFCVLDVHDPRRPRLHQRLPGLVALSLLMLPTVVKSCEEMLKIVPGDLREASYALGVTKQAHDHQDRVAHRPAGHRLRCHPGHRPPRGRRDRPAADDRRLHREHELHLFGGQMTTLPVYV